MGERATCNKWDNNVTDSYLKDNDGILPPNVRRSLKIIDHISSKIVEDGMVDVVSGFGLLNEPMWDCNVIILREFYNQGLNIVRKNMGETNVYIGDAFAPWIWNDGFWASEEYKGTYLDSHFYQLFDPSSRSGSPRQHIALVW